MKKEVQIDTLPIKATLKKPSIVRINTFRKRIDDFNNGIELFKKMKSGKIKLEEAKKLQILFKSNLNKTSRARYKSQEQKGVLENIKLLYESREAVINYLMIIIQLYLRLSTKKFMKKEFQVCQHACFEVA